MSLPFELTARDHTCAQAWLLKRRRPDRPPRPLLVARIAVRRRAARFEKAAALAMFLGFAGWSVAALTADGDSWMDTDAATLGAFLAGYVVLACGNLAALGYQRRGDRRVGDALRHRVARPVTPGVRSLLGRWFLAGHAAVYAGGVLAGLAAAATATDAGQRAVALVFVAAVVFFAGIAAAVVTDVAGRPAVAEDEETLADDDALRRQDARDRSSAPYVMALALLTAAFTPGGATTWLVVGYVVVAIPVWLWATFAGCRHQTPAAQPGLPATVGR